MFDVNDFHMVNHLVRNTFVLIGRVTKFSPTKILYIEDKILFSWEMAYEVHLWAHIWFTHENKFCPRKCLENSTFRQLGVGTDHFY